MLNKNEITISDDNNKIQDEEIIKNFFNIWILKEFIHNISFEKYYVTFLDKNGIVSNNLIKGKLEEIFKYISENNVTTDRPNNLTRLNIGRVDNILYSNGEDFDYGSDLYEEILTHIGLGSIDMILEGDGLIDYNNKRKEHVKKIRKGLLDYLGSLYNNGIYSLEVDGNIDKVIERIRKLLK